MAIHYGLLVTCRDQRDISIRRLSQKFDIRFSGYLIRDFTSKRRSRSSRKYSTNGSLPVTIASLYGRAIGRIDRGHREERPRPPNRDLRLILQTRRYAYVIDCPRNARRRRELGGCVREERPSPSTRRIEKRAMENEMERRRRWGCWAKRVEGGTRKGGRRHKFRASVKRALRGEAPAPPICQYPEEIRGGTWPEG